MTLIFLWICCRVVRMRDNGGYLHKSEVRGGLGPVRSEKDGW